MVDGEKPSVDMGYFLCRIVKYVRQIKKSVIFLYSTVLTATAARRVPFSLYVTLRGMINVLIVLEVLMAVVQGI